MNGQELFQTLTDIDDGLILEAEEAPPRQKPCRGLLRYAAAACLALVVVFTAIFATNALNMEPRLRYTVRYREHYVTYLMKVTAVQWGSMPEYTPDWLPGRYVPVREYRQDRTRDVTYQSSVDEGEYLWFHYRHITENTTHKLADLPLGSYETWDVDIGGKPGAVYRFTDGRTGGYLIWMDEESCTMLMLSFRHEDIDEMLRIARSVRKETK